jgi:hypothetical protein
VILKHAWRQNLSLPLCIFPAKILPFTRPPCPSWPDHQVVELGLFSAGSSNLRHRVVGTDEGFSDRKVMVRPERFETPGVLVRNRKNDLSQHYVTAADSPRGGCPRS